MSEWICPKCGRKFGGGKPLRCTCVILKEKKNNVDEKESEEQEKYLVAFIDGD